MRSYQPEELFDENGTLGRSSARLSPAGERRMGANPHANGGMLLRDLRMPAFRDYAVEVPGPARPAPRQPASRGASSATSSGTTPTTSASWARTRRPPTAGTRSSK